MRSSRNTTRDRRAGSPSLSAETKTGIFPKGSMIRKSNRAEERMLIRALFSVGINETSEQRDSGSNASHWGSSLHGTTRGANDGVRRDGYTPRSCAAGVI